MTKIGTVHVEVKPAPNLTAWDETCQRLEDKVAEAVRRGVERGMFGARTFEVRQPDGSTIAVEGTHLEQSPDGSLGIHDDRIWGDADAAR